jgi:hypothetical protein
VPPRQSPLANCLSEPRSECFPDAVMLLVPHHGAGTRQALPPAVRRRIDLGGQIAIGWLSVGGKVPLDLDRLDHVCVEEVSAARTGSLPVPRSALTVRVELSLVEQHLTVLAGRPPATPIRFRTGIHRLTPPVRHWLTRLAELVKSLESDPEIATEPWLRAEIEGWWIVTGLLYAQPHNHIRLLPREPAEAPLSWLRAGQDADEESIGPLIARRRHELGLSQSQLAQLLADASGTPSITRGRVSDYEHEKHIPDGWLEYLSIVLDIPIDDLEKAARVARANRYHRS